MQRNEKPLFSLTIGEFIALTKTVVNETIKENEQQGKQSAEIGDAENEHFSIKELSVFLRCSKVSIHNYKKMGMPFYRIGRKILFKKQEVLDFMKGIKSKRVIIDSSQK